MTTQHETPNPDSVPYLLPHCCSMVHYDFIQIRDSSEINSGVGGVGDMGRVINFKDSKMEEYTS